MTTENESRSIEQLKLDGNTAFQANRYEEAIENFSLAIEKFSSISQEPSTLESLSILYSNRSAAFSASRLWDEALEDADKAINLRPTWGKALGRRATALEGKGMINEAIECLGRALEFDPSNQQMAKSLSLLKSKPTPQSSFKNPFADPLLLMKLRSSSKCSKYLDDPEFVSKIESLQRDPNSLTQHLSDPRIMDALGYILGVPSQDEDTEHTESKVKPEAQCSSNCSSKCSTKEVKTEVQAEVEVKDPIEEQALILKEKGNSAYRQKNLKEALSYYEEACLLCPSNISLILNKSAVFFEEGQFQECINSCKEALEKGREQYADFKLMGRAYARLAASQEKLNDTDGALQNYKKALAEHRNPSTLASLKALEDRIRDEAHAALQDPALAEEERQKGNDAFKASDFPLAVKHYSEAIRRDDKDTRALCNRAACYTKLVAVPEGLKDCQRALIIDPSCTKAYVKMAGLYILKKEESKALDALEKAKELDSKDLKCSAEIGKLQQRILQGNRYSNSNSNSSLSEEEVMKRAMQDPEVQEIMQDPIMRDILRQMQSDPAAAQEHLKSPQVAAKIRKLVNCGILRTSQ